MLASFWGKFKHMNFWRHDVLQRLKIIERSCWPIVGYKCSSWPLQAAALTRIDKLQKSLYGDSLHLQWRGDDTPKTYNMRKGVTAAKYVAQIGKWSMRWWAKAANHYDHMCRAHKATDFSLWLLRFQNAIWLRSKRSLFGFASLVGRSGTRAKAGKIAARFEESLWEYNTSYESAYVSYHVSCFIYHFACVI